MLCLYKFPCHPSEMFGARPILREEARILRTDMIQNIAMLSQTYSQKQIDNKVFVDLDANGHIIGMDMAAIYKINIDACIGANRLALKHMTADSWKTMKLRSA